MPTRAERLRKNGRLELVMSCRQVFSRRVAAAELRPVRPVGDAREIDIFLDFRLKLPCVPDAVAFNVCLATLARCYRENGSLRAPCSLEIISIGRKPVNGNRVGDEEANGGGIVIDSAADCSLFAETPCAAGASAHFFV